MTVAQELVPAPDHVPAEPVPGTPAQAGPEAGAAPARPVAGLSRPTGGPEAGQSESESAQSEAEQEADAGPGYDGPVGRSEMPASRKLNVAPSSMAELLACSDTSIHFLCGQRSPDGPLMKLLKTAFEADWFKAKACLVFGKWPTSAPRAFSDKAALELMTAFTELRGEVHKVVMPEAQKAMRALMMKRAAELKGNEKLAGTLSKEKGKAPAEQVQYKGSVGADTVTSDVDVSTGGANSELAVRAYNEAFRTFLGMPLDPGTVFDLNVYAMDFVFGKTDSNDKKSFTVNAENAEATEEFTAGRDEEQEIWSLVHVARYMTDEDWAKYVKDSLAGIVQPERAAYQQRLLTKARGRAKGFQDRLASMMEHLEKEVDTGLAKLGPSSWDEQTNAHYTEGALRMRAANRLYEDKLLQVKEIRAQIAEVREQEPGSAQLRKLVADLTGALSMAQLYANEVYGTGGATVHAVFGMQTKKKLEAERRHKVEVIMPPEQWYQTFTDNLGDVMKDYEHFAHGHGNETPDYWYAAFKMGKYVDRMLDAIPHLWEGDAPLVSAADAEALLLSPDIQTLQALATNHVKEKSGPAKDDPRKLADHPYFKGLNSKGAIDDIKKITMELGSQIRAMVANHKGNPATALAAEQPAPAAAPAAPGQIEPGDHRVAVLTAMLERAQRAEEGVEREGEGEG